MSARSVPASPTADASCFVIDFACVPAGVIDAEIDLVTARAWPDSGATVAAFARSTSFATAPDNEIELDNVSSRTVSNAIVPDGVNDPDRTADVAFDGEPTGSTDPAAAFDAASASAELGVTDPAVALATRAATAPVGVIPPVKVSRAARIAVIAPEGVREPPAVLVIALLGAPVGPTAPAAAFDAAFASAADGATVPDRAALVAFDGEPTGVIDPARDSNAARIIEIAPDGVIPPDRTFCACRTTAPAEGTVPVALLDVALAALPEGVSAPMSAFVTENGDNTLVGVTPAAMTFCAWRTTVDDDPIVAVIVDV